MKMFSRRWCTPCLVLFAMVVLSLAPAGVSAADEPAAATDAPAEPAQPAEGGDTQAGSGWVPQEPAPEASGGAPSSAQQGSSLGSGGSAAKAPAPSKPPSSGGESTPAPAPAPAPTPVPSSTGSPEPESSSAPPPEESAAPPQPDAAAAPRPREVKADDGPPPALGAARPVARPEPSDAGAGGPAAASAASAATSAQTSSSGSGGLPWPVWILCGLLFLGALGLLLGETDIRFRSARGPSLPAWNAASAPAQRSQPVGGQHGRHPAGVAGDDSPR